MMNHDHSESPTILLRISDSSFHMHRSFNDFGQAIRSAEAYAGAVSQLAASTAQAMKGDQAAARLAIHLIQDSYASGHQFQAWSGGAPSLGHDIGDAIPNIGPMASSIRYLKDLQHRQMRPGIDYLFKPKNCPATW